MEKVFSKLQDSSDFRASVRLQDVIADFMNDSGGSVGFFGTVSFPKEPRDTRRAVQSGTFVSLPSFSASVSLGDGDGKETNESVEGVVYVEDDSSVDDSLPSRRNRDYSNAL